MDEQFSFEKLHVYQRALVFSKQIIKVISPFSKNNFSWCDQLRRASMSITLNIAEGGGRESLKEKKNFYTIARGSTYECVPLLELGLDLQSISSEQYKIFRQECVEISKMLSGLIKNLEDKS